ncbi:MAG TPA: hypothetical protein VFN36_05755 [Solirubrobacteraceae bacterium]|nr:hypothetical protein [Solirubrobacteraceae bacterium]
MSDDPLIHPGDLRRDDPIRRRSDEEIERELAVDRSREQHPHGSPGGAEGGEHSRSADAIVDVPGEPGPLGDTDQHSDPEDLPRHRERENERRE